MNKPKPTEEQKRQSQSYPSEKNKTRKNPQKHLHVPQKEGIIGVSNNRCVIWLSCGD